MSREEDFRKAEEGLKLLALNYQRIVSKFQHLRDSLGYLGDDLVMFSSTLNVVNEVFQKLKGEEVKKVEHGRGSKPAKEAHR